MSGKNIILVGATGMVGGLALDICLYDPDVSRVTVVGRRSVGVEHEKLREILHDDFTDFTSITEEFEGKDAALFCLGAYTGAVPDDQFRRITVDYTLEFAKTLYEKSPQAGFCFLSGQGADQTERSRVAFAKYKGAAEKGLSEIGFPRVYIFRPAYIYPVTPRKEPNLVYRVTRMLYPVLRVVYPGGVITSEDLARAMVHAGLNGTGGHEDPILENRDIKSLAKVVL